MCRTNKGKQTKTTPLTLCDIKVSRLLPATVMQAPRRGMSGVRIEGHSDASRLSAARKGCRLRPDC